MLVVGTGSYDPVLVFITTFSGNALYLSGDIRFESLRQLCRPFGCPVLFRDFIIFPDECLDKTFLHTITYLLFLVLFDAI